jgi:hypothetical protein
LEEHHQTASHFPWEIGEGGYNGESDLGYDFWVVPVSANEELGYVESRNLQ